jgi:hypothetical protein
LGVLVLGSIEWMVTSDYEYDIRCSVVYAERPVADMRAMLTCPGCERLWVFWDGFESVPMVNGVDQG